MTLTEFLMARIEEDEANANDPYWNMADEGVITTARLLYECEAKRMIIELRNMTRDAVRRFNRPADRAAFQSLDYALRYLALPYADHPDYRREWLA